MVRSVSNVLPEVMPLPAIIIARLVPTGHTVPPERVRVRRGKIPIIARNMLLIPILVPAVIQDITSITAHVF